MRRSEIIKAILSVWGVPLGAVFFVFCLWVLPSEERVPPDVLAEQVTGVIPVGGDRSSHWPTVREEFALEHPECEACGGRQSLNVHHVKPFHDYPELELDPDNLITLCREHHFRIGHDPDGVNGPARPNWKLANPNVRSEAAEQRKKLAR